MERNALILGASGGIGAALDRRLTRAGWAVTGLSRRTDGFDYGDPDSVDRLLGRLEAPFHLVLVATGALEIGGHGPEKSLREIEAPALAAQFATNAIGPALVLRHAPRLLPRDRRAVFGVLSARVGSIGDNRLGGWYGYRASKAALNQILRTGAIELARTHKQSICVALHPGTVDTGLTATYGKGHVRVHAHEAAANLLHVIDSLSPADSGQFFDWMGKRVLW